MDVRPSLEAGKEGPIAEIAAGVVSQMSPSGCAPLAPIVTSLAHSNSASQGPARRSGPIRFNATNVQNDVVCRFSRPLLAACGVAQSWHDIRSLQLSR
jgi:hypothetical protein